jgi:hypothetical protein
MMVGVKFGIKALAAFVLAGCALTAAPLRPPAFSPDHPRAHPARKAKPKTVPTPPPASPLNVSYENGLLSISAQDASLSEVLAQLHQRTGASINLPKGMDEHVAVELGPGPAVQVVAALLEVTQFNYVIVGAASPPGAVRSIQLSAKPAFVVEAAASPPAPVRPVAPQSGVKPSLTGSDEGVWNDVEVPAATAQPADTAVRPPR